MLRYTYVACLVYILYGVGKTSADIDKWYNN
jgi:hypothetical protein